MVKASAPRPWRAIVAFLALAAFIAGNAHADPAGRIGRIAWLNGSIFLNNPSTGEANAALLNHPLTSGDVLTTDADSRAEIEIGSITIRLDSASRLEFERIDDTQIRAVLNDGRAIVKLPSGEAVNDFSLVTRDGRFTARNTGIYRFDTDARSSVATVLYGALQVGTNDSTIDIGAGQRLQVWFDGQTTRYRQLAAANDDFTQWSATRDQRSRSSLFARYVSPEMTGAQDLDAYGNWQDTQEYGAIWFPRHVADDWAPYRTGQWVWVEPWGWNWVGYEPWGFAPFHYGRWVRHRGMWGWVPGQRIARPVYAPAMVAWIGTPGASLSLSIGSAPSVGWFPLAPHEVYVPAYRSSANYVRNINITHVSRITNITTIVNNPQAVVQQTRYAHRDLPQAVSAVHADAFSHRRPVAPTALSRTDFHALQKQPIQAAAPVTAPRPAPMPRIETSHQQERLERSAQPSPAQGFQPPVHREREAQPLDNAASSTPVLPGRTRGRDSTPPSPISPPQTQTAAPTTVPQRGEKSPPDIARQLPTPTVRQESSEPRAPSYRRHEEPAAPSSQPHTITPPASPSPSNERTAPEIARPTPTPPSRLEPLDARTPEHRRREAPVEPSAPAVSPGRNERPMPDSVRPAPSPQLRQEMLEQRTQERPARREEAFVRPASSEARTEPPAQQSIRPASPPPVQEIRREAPREVSRPSESRAENRPHASRDKQERRREDETEKH